MNKIYTILLLSLTLFVAGCSDDDDDKVVQNLKVIESQTEYPSLGGTGTIEVSSVGAFTATSSETWCKPSISGNIITVAIDQNTEIDGRHARITIESGNEKAYVAISQLGTTFIADKSSLAFSLSGGKDKITFSSEKPVTVDLKSTSSWLSYVIKDDTITFTATKAATEKTAEIELSSGILKKTITVTQSLGYDDLLGNWKLTGVDGSGTSVVSNAVISENVNGESYYITGISPYLTVKYNLLYNAQKKNLIFKFPTYAGRFGVYYLYACAYDATVGTLSWSTAIEYEGTMDSSASSLTYKFKDNGTWTGYTCDGLYYGAFTSETPSSAGYAGGTGILINIAIEKQ